MPSVHPWCVEFTPKVCRLYTRGMWSAAPWRNKAKMQASARFTPISSEKTRFFPILAHKKYLFRKKPVTKIIAGKSSSLSHCFGQFPHTTKPTARFVEKNRTFLHFSKKWYKKSMKEAEIEKMSYIQSCRLRNFSCWVSSQNWKKLKIAKVIGEKSGKRQKTSIFGLYPAFTAKWGVF